MISPSDLSTAVGTPDSPASGNVPPPQSYALRGQGMGPGYGIPVPDLTTMFPSGDPFAYPNQPMMEYENNINNFDIKQENLNTPGTDSGEPPNTNGNNDVYNDSGIGMFMGNGTAGQGQRLFDDIEGQLFGPLPPYLTHGQQVGSGYDNIPGQPPATQGGLMNGINGNENNMSLGIGGVETADWAEDTPPSAPNPSINMFGMDGEGWESLMGDQVYKSYQGELLG